VATADVAPHQAYAPQTITEPQALFDRISADHTQRFSIVDEELERGPARDRRAGSRPQRPVVGAINLSTHSTRTTRNEMREHFLPELNRVAEHISSMTV
jgi:IclR family pca regulon transcriptional regulator